MRHVTCRSFHKAGLHRHDPETQHEFEFRHSISASSKVNCQQQGPLNPHRKIPESPASYTLTLGGPTGRLTAHIPNTTASMTIAASLSLGTAALACLGVIFIGVRFILAPRVGAAGFGVRADDTRAFTAIKGVRDIASGLVLLVVWRVAGQQALGWALVTAAFTPIGDALIVVSRGGDLSAALGIHGVTAAVLVTAGLVLARS